MALPEYRWVSVEEYLAIDNASDVRFEYVNGQLRMLAGGSRNHALIAHNLHGLLHNHLRGTPPNFSWMKFMNAPASSSRIYCLLP